MIHEVSNIDIDWAEVIAQLVVSQKLAVFSTKNKLLTAHFVCLPHQMSLYKLNFYLEKIEGWWLHFNTLMTAVIEGS